MAYLCYLPNIDVCTSVSNWVGAGVGAGYMSGYGAGVGSGYRGHWWNIKIYFNKVFKFKFCIVFLCFCIVKTNCIEQIN